MDGDKEAREDELMALESIFGDREMQLGYQNNGIEFGIPSFDAVPRIEMSVFLPLNYPSESGPVFELRSDPKAAINDETMKLLAEEMNGMWRPGEVCLWPAHSRLREFWDERQQQQQQQKEEEEKVKDIESSGIETMEGIEDVENNDDHFGPEIHEPHSNIRDQVEIPDIISGEPITERKSTFQAHLAHVKDTSQVELVMEALLQNNKIRNATHNIMAYRICREGVPGSFLQDCDDDGEQAAGGRLLHLLQLTDARNVMVVVSRWFGGVLLGPARFGLINKAARDLLEECNLIHKHTTKKSKAETGKQKARQN